MILLGIDTTDVITALALIHVDDTCSVLFNKKRQYNTNASWDVLPFIFPPLHRKSLPILWQELKKEQSHLLDNCKYCAVSAFSGVDTCIKEGRIFFKSVIKKEYPHIKLLLVDHLKAHLYSSWIEQADQIQFPLLAISASGSHNLLVHMKNKDKATVLVEGAPRIWRYRANVYAGLGKIFYFAAKILTDGLEREILNNFFDDFYAMVERGVPIYENDFFKCFSDAMLHLDFSILIKRTEGLLQKNSDERDNIAASFYEAYAKLVVRVIMNYQDKYKCKQIHVCGGISNNKRIFSLLCEKANSVLVPLESYKYDNAAMIAYTAYLEKTNRAYVAIKPSVYSAPLKSKILNIWRKRS